MPSYPFLGIGRQPSYRAWLLSDTAVHAATGYQDKGGGNTLAPPWQGQFSLLAENLDTSDAVNLAYSRSLQKHHSFLQRQAFSLVYSQLPARDELMKILEGRAPQQVALEVDGTS
eukprot:Skav224447  [mRNA]  locus=scaffold3543:100465:103320:- [translate_table: standard]